MGTLGLKIDAAFLTVLVTLHAFVRGKKSPSAAPRTVVVANFTGNIGDMVCTTPVFRAIKRAHPTCRVVVVGVKKNKELLSGNTDIDEYIVHDGGGIGKTVTRLRALSPDWGIAMNPSPHEVALLLLSGAATVAFTNPEFGSRALAAVSRFTIRVPYRSGRYVPREYLKILEPFGIQTEDTEKHLAVDAGAVAAVKEKLRTAGIPEKTPLVIFAPPAGQAYKMWPAERFAGVANHLAGSKNVALAVIGGPTDSAAGEAFIRGVSGVVYNAIGQPIEELKALISTARLIVANDSGPVYIAEAFNVATLVIAGVHDPVEHPPRGAKNRIVDAPVRTITLRSLISDFEHVDPDAARRQMESITVEAVNRELDELSRVIF